MPAKVLVLGTCDTKLQELLFLKKCIRRDGAAEAILLDVGRENIDHEEITISQAQLVRDHGDGKTTSDLPRSELIRFMAGCAAQTVKRLFEGREISAVVSAGGSGGTSLAAQVMREVLPIGFPKMIISTVASGDTGPIVGETDISMIYSVVDVAGLNQVLRDIFSNAGAAIGAMARTYETRRKSDNDDGEKTTTRGSAKRVGITMFGVTTPSVDVIRNHLEAKYGVEVYVFHATGHGGKAMERLVRQGKLDGVLDLTTTEICDLVTGGVMSAGENRLEAAVEAGIPYIVSVGATDMSNFGPRNTVPEAYKDRLLYEHNPTVTLMRSSEEECRKVGRFITEKLRTARKTSSVQVWLPLGGVSMISTAGGPFADEEADEALFSTIREGLQGSGIKVVEDQRDINDEGFARDIAEALARLMSL
ncbi:hypothetical protein M406DRAFT_342101 [Cryphonectria parasitica EP155]|uniref:Uncharacterized protein n=1 Tax=Cryphonectria parasitica (strain ATCC 38755 / EP155) TaxID=660469 RepID=A0A9P5CKK8_CRYP1|nr:uncharacterized protein M406DRAFT_342101 [Cryphonectria parasitica EP155]KAF3761267.1 hypothetical protein M406DRAFT_342101 [Cryphonectria parasitica EP155]